MESSPLLQKPSMPLNVISRLRMRDAGRYLVGVLLLLSVVFLWTASNFITANLETGQGGWNKPFLITYFNTASFTIYLIPTLWRRYRSKSTRSPPPSSQHINHHDHDHEHLLAHAQPDRLSLSHSDSLSLSRRSRSPSPCVPPSPRVAIHSLDLDLDRHLEDLPENSTLSLDVETTREGEGGKLSMRETAEIAALWSIVWFVANWAVNASLAWTSVASVTVLSSTSGFFTLALGRICGVEDLTRTKVFAVVASFLGVLLVTHSDSSLASTTMTFDAHSTSHALFGDALALLSAGCYAVYVILLKVRVVDEDRADMQLMLGFAGLFNTIALIPIFPILHYLQWETFELPPTKSAWIICLINFCITLSSDYLYVLAMLKTTPMLVTIGLSLTIPLALIGSILLPSIAVESVITTWSLLGASLVFVGFGILGWQGYVESRVGDAGFLQQEREEEEGDDDQYEYERGRSTSIR